MAHSEQITLDVNKKHEYSIDPIRLRRGEGGLTTIDATILDNGNPYNLSGSSVMFYSYDAKGDYIYENATIKSSASGSVSYTVSARLTGQPGDIRVAYFRISNGANSITTQNIPILVLENVDISGEEAEEYRSQFEELLEAIQGMQAEVNGYLEDVDTVTTNANNAAASANTAASNANTATTNANNARDAANDAASSANDAAKTATDSAEAANDLVASVNNEWASLKPSVEAATSSANNAASEARSAATETREATNSANQATSAANSATQSAEDATRQALEATQNAYDAAGEVITAVSDAQAQTAIMREALSSYDAITGSDIAYAVGDSSTEPPLEGWTAGRQTCPQGMYEWVRTITHYQKAQDTVTYSVSYQGVDGRDGIGVESSSLYWLWTDDEGNLWATYSDAMNAPQFRYDESSGNLYVNV